MKKLVIALLCYSVIGLMSTNVFAAFGGAGTATGSGNYGDWVKYISLVTGTTYSAWIDRGDVASYAAMTAAGDGTYYAAYNLFPGVEYNFTFFATYGGTPPNGLTGQTTYYDAGRSDGTADTAFFVATDSNNVTGTRVPGAAKWTSIGGDGRRSVTPPQDTGYSVSSTSGVWVYCNWMSSPVVSINATPASNASVNVELGAYGGWGTDDEAFKAIDVYAGGKWDLYRALDLGGAYALKASSTSAQLGANMTFLDEGLTGGNTYYYIAVASDAYKGAMNALAADGCLTTILADGTIDATGKTPTAIGFDDSARPADAIPVYFKVEAPNWDYIKEHDSIVYLTPVGIDGRAWPYKIPGKICRVYLPKS